jgi:hypothetical protein
MNPRVLLSFILLLLLVPAVSAGTYQFTFTFNGECPPDGQVEVTAFDLTGRVAVSTSMQVGETRTFTIDSGFENLVWVVRCNGKEVYRKRYDLPGARWKAVPGYPYDIARMDDLPNGTPLSANTTAIIKNPADCGNGEIDPGEGCDTLGNKGCTDPSKPVCYDCAYCGCGDANDCPWVSGTINCGDAGCPPWSRPQYGRVCADGVCLNPVKCVIDPDCLAKYQGEEKPAAKETSTETHPLSVGPRVYEDPAFNLILAEERFGDTIPPIPVNAVGGMLFDVLPAGASETYTIDGTPYAVTFIGPGCGAAAADSCTSGAFMVNGNQVLVPVGAGVFLKGGVDLVLREVRFGGAGGETAADFYLSALTPRQLLDLLYCAGDTAELPAAEGSWAAGAACNGTCTTCTTTCTTCAPSGWKPEFGVELLGLDPADSRPQALDPALAGLIGNDRITLSVGNETSYLAFENGALADFGEGAHPATTVRVATDPATADAIRSGELTVLEAMDQGRVRIDGEGVVNGVRIWAAKLLHDIGRIFS